MTDDCNKGTVSSIVGKFCVIDGTMRQPDEGSVYIQNVWIELKKKNGWCVYDSPQIREKKRRRSFFISI